MPRAMKLFPRFSITKPYCTKPYHQLQPDQKRQAYQSAKRAFSILPAPAQRDRVSSGI